MKVALIRPNATFDEFKIYAESLALGYLAAYLRNKGIEVDIIDAYLENLSIENLVEMILNNHYKIVGVTIYSSAAMAWAKSVANEIKSGDPNIHVTIGGHLPSFDYEYILTSTPIDSIVLFEGEETLLELTQKIIKGDDWKDIFGIAFIQDGRVIKTSPRHLIFNLDNLPYPSRDYLTFLQRNYHDEYLVYVSWGRGCYHRCKFCSIPAFFSSIPGRRVRQRSVDNMIEELIMLKNNYQINYVVFIDDIFVLPNKNGYKRVYTLLDGIKKLGIRFAMSERVDVLTENLIKRLVDSGLVRIFLGVEAADDEILERMNKKITREQIEKILNTLADEDIDVEISFINFLPFNTLEHIENNIKFFSEWNVDILRSIGNRLEPYPGTEFYNELMLSNNLYRLEYSYYFKKNFVDERVNILYDYVEDLIPYWGIVSIYLQKLKSFLWKEVPIDVRQIYRQKMLDLQQAIMQEVKDYFLHIISCIKAEEPLFICMNMKYSKMEHKNLLQSFLSKIIDLHIRIKEEVRI